jgi:hypothetical protein
MHARMIGLALAGLVSAATVTACGSGGGGSAEAARPVSAQNSAQIKANKSATTTASEGAGLVSAATQPDASGAAPIASRTASYGVDKVRVDLQSLRRDGELSTLALRVTNLGSDEYSVDHDFGDVSNYDLSGITLIDGKNSKRYLVGRDSKDRCVCTSTIALRIQPRASYNLTATFAAPPADVTSLEVSIPGLGTLNDVPVS